MSELRVKADLHVHSVRSDGSLCREEILARAKKMKLTHLAFTEHDSTTFVQEAVELGKEYGICVIPGLEISAVDKTTGRKVHVLGYNFKQTSHIDRLCKPLLRERNENCLKQIAVLQTYGFRISAEQVNDFVHGESIYKQHIMAYLCETGQVEEMFGRFYHTVFKNGGICDFDIEYIAMEDAVKAIADDGGIPVLAHPGQQQNFDVVSQLVEQGLKGIEYNHPANREKDKEEIAKLAEKYHLILTGGSDFHGCFAVDGTELGGCLSMPNPLLG